MKLRMMMVVFCTAFVIPLFAQNEGTYLIRYFNSPSGATSVGGVNLTDTGSSIGLQVNLTPAPGQPNTEPSVGRTPPLGGGAYPGLFSPSPAPQISNGNICANVYVLDPNQELIECCSCPLTPNSLASLAVWDLISNTLTGVIPTSFSVKLVASVASSSFGGGVTVPNGACDVHTAATVGAIDDMGNPIGPPLATGLAAWAITTHGTTLTETAFTLGQLSNANNGYIQGIPEELQRLTGRCAAIINQNGNLPLGSGFGICKACTVGTL